MARKLSHSSKSMEPPEVDNLQLIKGIGPAVERRLNSVGIFTFIQLSALSPADLTALVADLHGLSTENIMKQDWIGQAHTLASKEKIQGRSGPVASPEPDTTSKATNNYRTPAITMKSDPETGKDLANLVQLKTALTGELQIRELNIITTHGYNQSGLLRSNEPFTLEIILDLARIVQPRNATFLYKVSLYGKDLEKGTHQKIGESQGIIQSSDSIKVKVEVSVLSQGLFHLEAMAGVNLYQEHGRPRTVPDLIASAESRPLYFY